MIEAVNWQRAVISEHASFKEAFQNLNDVAIRLCICASDDGGLAGLITDGDLRRGLLKGLSMEDSITEVINRNPLVVPEGLLVLLGHSVLLGPLHQQLRPVHLHHLVHQLLLVACDGRCSLDQVASLGLGAHEVDRAVHLRRVEIPVGQPDEGDRGFLQQLVQHRQRKRTAQLAAE